MQSRVCLVRHRYYPGDWRIETQVQALLKAGYDVDVLCMRRCREPYTSSEEGVRVYRLPALPHKRGSRFRYFAEYSTFLLISFLSLSLLQIRRKYSLVHVHNLPDFLVLAALIPKALGAKVILDLRECTPEMYHAKYGSRMDSAFVRVLIAIEQSSIRFADAALTCTEQMRHAFVLRGANPNNVFVMLNAANPELFRDPRLPDPADQGDGTFHVVTHGTITKRYGHDFLIRAMALVVEKVPGARLEIMGMGNRRTELRRLVDRLGLGGVVTFVGYVPADELVRRLREAGCGVVSLIRNIETDLVHTYKMQEYMALGIPVVTTRTRAVEAYYDDTCVCFVESGNEQDLAQAIIRLHDNPHMRHSLAKNALRVYERYSAPKQEAHYIKLVQRLLGRAP